MLARRKKPGERREEAGRKKAGERRKVGRRS
jgi:hypothetical protein